MTHALPARVGMPLSEVETPALLIDLDAFERNLRAMADDVQRYGVRHRPHAKTHKSPAIALKQIAAGAVGNCCQTVGEAEALVHGGVGDVLVSNQVIGAAKIARVAALARDARVGVCVDAEANVSALSEAAESYRSTLDVLVEIDVGMARCGVAPGEPALALARHIAAAPGLRFAGLQAYHGSAQHIREFDERRAAVDEAIAVTRETVELLAGAGLECELVSGAGTGTYPFEAASGVYNELQAGSYIFMDVDYGKNLNEQGKPFDRFEQSLFVLATVISTPTSERAIIDAGLKAHSVDSGLPALAGFADVRYTGASDEHGKLDLSGSNHRFEVGEKVRLVPGHCDPTVNLYDWYVGFRGYRVEALWPVAARGPGA